MPSKIFGPTDSVADTLTQIGSTYQMIPKAQFIYKIIVAKGNVVNAKECAGHILVETVLRSYHFAYGNGSGGATNSANMAAEPIECAIPVPASSSVKVYALDATVAKDVTVCLQFDGQNYGAVGGRLADPMKFKTLAAGGISANADTAADTEESFTVSSKLTRATLVPEAEGRIYQIRIAGSGVVDAKAGSGKISVIVPSIGEPYEYAIGNGSGGATLGGCAWADVINIPEGIPVKPNATVDVKITTAEIMKTPVVSLSYW